MRAPSSRLRPRPRRAFGLIGLVCAALGSGACEQATAPPLGHVVLHIDTDAPVPPSPGEPPRGGRAAALFDRLRLEIFEPGATEPCAGCVREFDLDEGMMARGATMTIVPEDATRVLRVRARLLRARALQAGAPAPATMVEVVARLPLAPGDGNVDASVFLGTDSVGVPEGTLEEPVEATLGLPGPSRVGTWPRAQRVPCAGNAPEGAVCIPGGAYWMGNPLLHLSREQAANEERLVVLAPFYIDDREVTVAAYRASKPAAVNGIATYAPWSGGTSGAHLEDWCTLPVKPDPARESLPMSCVAWTGARSYCKKRLGDLPSEAQFEYVASALESRDFPWGRDDPSCDDAVWGQGGTGIAADTHSVCLAGEQRKRPASFGGPQPVPEATDEASLRRASRLRARLQLEGGTVWDLAGNLAEWMRDAYATQSDPCWSTRAGSIFVDPVCEKLGAGVPEGARSVRGGGWFDAVYGLAAATRNVQLDGSAYEFVGFRCVYPGN